MEDRSDDPAHHERTLLTRSHISPLTQLDDIRYFDSNLVPINVDKLSVLMFIQLPATVETTFNIRKLTLKRNVGDIYKWLVKR